MGSDSLKIDVRRKCPYCEGAMEQIGVDGGAPLYVPWLRDNSFRVFSCSQCQQKINLPTTGLLVAQFITAVFTFVTCVLIFWNNDLLQLWTALTKAPLAAMIGIVMTLIAALLLCGGVWNAIELIRNLRLLRRAPQYRHKSFWAFKVIGTVLYSLVPWGYWIGAGFVNDIYLQIDRDWSFVLVAPGLLPFFFADRFGLSPTVIFLLSASYPTAGFIYMWLS